MLTAIYHCLRSINTYIKYGSNSYQIGVNIYTVYFKTSPYGLYDRKTWITKKIGFMVNVRQIVI